MDEGVGAEGVESGAVGRVEGHGGDTACAAGGAEGGGVGWCGVHWKGGGFGFGGFREGGLASGGGEADVPCVEDSVKRPSADDMVRILL